MANLNFTRNIGGGSLSRAANVGAAFSGGGGSGGAGGGTGGGGHVTPVFGQRTADRRNLTMGGSSANSGGSSGGMNSSSLVNYSSFNSVFGGGDSGAPTPSLLDLSEFPSLTARNALSTAMTDATSMSGVTGGGGGVSSSMGGGMMMAGNMVATNSGVSGGGSSVGGNASLNQSNMLLSGSKPYVGMVKQPMGETSEFTMSSEDFPALPGTRNSEVSSGGGCINSAAAPGSAISSAGVMPTAIGQAVGSTMTTVGSYANEKLLATGGGADSAANGLIMDGVLASREGVKSIGTKTGIQTSPDGRVTNIPASMVNDQFGIVGLLTFIRAAETDPNLVSLALGQDLTALGLNMNSTDNLYPMFGGPWADCPCRPQDIDFRVPPEYVINSTIRDKLASMKLGRYKDDLLFFMFYNNVGDILQVAAANELYSREWRYHTEEKVWITQVPGMMLQEKTSTYERGTYYFFDVQTWRKIAKEFHLDYSKLEGRPTIAHTIQNST